MLFFLDTASSGITEHCGMCLKLLSLLVRQKKGACSAPGDWQATPSLPKQGTEWLIKVLNNEMYWFTFQNSKGRTYFRLRVLRALLLRFFSVSSCFWAIFWCSVLGRKTEKLQICDNTSWIKTNKQWHLETLDLVELSLFTPSLSHCSPWGSLKAV